MSNQQKLSLVDKASTQNVVAAIVVISATLSAIYFGKWEMVAVIAGFALGYLFPKKDIT